jgi:hypothetical protein
VNFLDLPPTFRTHWSKWVIVFHTTVPQYWHVHAGSWLTIQMWQAVWAEARIRDSALMKQQ